MAGGWHGIVFATLLFTAMGLLGMGIATVVAAILDGSRAVREGIERAPVVRSEVLEHGAGQLSEAGSEGALGHAAEPGGASRGAA